jgi:hypothetical protein
MWCPRFANQTSGNRPPRSMTHPLPPYGYMPAYVPPPSAEPLVFAQ